MRSDAAVAIGRDRADQSRAWVALRSLWRGASTEKSPARVGIAVYCKLATRCDLGSRGIVFAHKRDSVADLVPQVMIFVVDRNDFLQFA